MRLVALPSRKQAAYEPRGLDYARFIILSGPRTGSNLLAQALGSNPSVTCFREIFNATHDFVQFDAEGYDNFAREDCEDRKRDPALFLESRVFCPHPLDVDAVGFKFHYGQFWGFPGILERLVSDPGVRVIHLHRRNKLRALVSLRLAQRTGAFMTESRRQPVTARIAFACQHPFRAAKRFRRVLTVPTPALRIAPSELASFIIKTNQTARHYDKLFRKHATLHLEYEELARENIAVVNQASRFLGVTPTPPIITLRKQHPEPLWELIENYDQLRSAFEGTPHRMLFDEDDT